MPLLHWASVEHADGQEADEPLQTKVPHEGLPELPAATGLHVPSLPARLHASHEAPHVELQQKPSTQLPLVHSEAAEHAPPLGFWLVQTPLKQVLPLAHWLSLVQAAGQDAEEPLHRNGAQVGLPALPAATGLHVPTLPVTLQALQEPPQAVLQHTPSTHCPLPHWLEAEQVAPFCCLGTHAPALQ